MLEIFTGFSVLGNLETIPDLVSAFMNILQIRHQQQREHSLGQGGKYPASLIQVHLRHLLLPSPCLLPQL